MTTSTNAGGARAWVIYALPALLATAVGAWALRWTCDDAFISFRYAQNLVAGHGLVYNVGENPPVEGYSNLLWTLLAAVPIALGFDPAAFASVLATASAAVLVLLVARFAYVRIGLSAQRAGLTALFFGILPIVSCWATGGLETMTFALAVFLVYERLAAGPCVRGWQAGLAAAVAALLRADGAGFALAALVVAWIDLGARPEARAAIVRAAMLLAAAVCAQLAFRLAWHEDWIPNTARVKAGLSAMRLERGLKYAGAMLLAMPVLAFAPLLALIATRGSAKCPRRVTHAASAFAAIVLGYAVWTGGDFLPFGRFLAPLAPFAALAFAALLAGRARWPRIAAGLLIAVAPLSTLGIQATPEALHFRWNAQQPITERAMWAGARQRALEWRRLGRALHGKYPGGSIVLDAIGAVGYESGLRVHDLFGLISPEVARSGLPLVRASPGHDVCVDPEFFLPARPDVLGAWVAPATTTLDALPERWRDLVGTRRARVERFPLRPEEGFPPGSELRVLRLVHDG